MDLIYWDKEEQFVSSNCDEKAKMNTLNSELLPLQHINDCKPFVVVNDGFVTQESSQTVKTQREFSLIEFTNAIIILLIISSGFNLDFLPGSDLFQFISMKNLWCVLHDYLLCWMCQLTLFINQRTDVTDTFFFFFTHK